MDKQCQQMQTIVYDKRHLVCDHLWRKRLHVEMPQLQYNIEDGTGMWAWIIQHAYLSHPWLTSIIKSRTDSAWLQCSVAVWWNQIPTTLSDLPCSKRLQRALGYFRSRTTLHTQGQHLPFPQSRLPPPTQFFSLKSSHLVTHLQGLHPAITWQKVPAHWSGNGFFYVQSTCTTCKIPFIGTFSLWVINNCAIYWPVS